MEKGFQINEAELMDFFNGKLSPEEEEKVLAWKESDEANLRIFEEVRIKNLLMCQAVRARLIRGDFGVLRKRLGVSPRRAIRYYWGVAAAVIAIAIMSVIFWPETSSENRLLIASQNAKPKTTYDFGVG